MITFVLWNESRRSIYVVCVCLCVFASYVYGSLYSIISFHFHIDFVYIIYEFETLKQLPPTIMSHTHTMVLVNNVCAYM